MTRYYEETPCEVCGSNVEHGGVHYKVVDRGTPESWTWKTCEGSGGQRRELTSGEVSKLLIDPTGEEE